MTAPAEPAESGTDSPGSVTIVGTAHVSEESVREVEATIEAERPDVVAVELDEGRYRQLQGNEPEDLDASDLLKGNTVFQFLAYWMLSYVQTKIGERFDVKPGADMLAAIESAQEHGSDVALVDREIQQTIQRFWARMTILEKLRMVGGLAFGITDNRAIGIVVGLLVGLVVGPAITLYGGGVGVSIDLLTSITGGLLLGVFVTFVIDTFAGPFLGGETRLQAALVGGGLAGVVGGIGMGLADGVVTRFLGDFAITVIGGMTIGLVGGAALGVVAAGAIGLFGRAEPPEGGIDELDMSELTDTDVVTMMMEEFRRFSPGGAEALIDERDAYISHQLVALRDAGYDVVAVVGAGHKQGIERYLADPQSLPPMSTLVGTETGRGIPWGKIVGSLFSVAFVAFFVLLAMAGVRDGFLLQVFGAWFLINAVFAASLAKLAGARWSSAGVGGAVAWLTSINPLLAPGWFAGYMELRHLKVNVGDISTLNELLSDETRPVTEIVSDMFEVPLFKLIMVVALTNIGSIIASLLFVIYVLPLFAADLGGLDGVSQLMIEGARNSAELIWNTIA